MSCGREVVRLIRVEKSTLVFLLVGMFVAGSVFGVGVYFVASNSVFFRGGLSLNGVRESSTKIAAVGSQGEGVLADLKVQLQPGDGEVFYRIEPYAQVDLQYSANTAVKVASEIAGTSLGSIDVSFTIDAGQAQIIGGPSAGAAMTITTLAAIENKKIKDNVVITGQVREDGSIGQVGGIIAKAEAASDAGKEMFLVPDGQSKVVTYKRVKHQISPFSYYVTYEPQIIDLNDYAENREWGIKITEVTNIQEAANLMIE